MKTKIFIVLALIITLVPTATTYAQAASTEDSGEGLPLQGIAAIFIILIMLRVVVFGKRRSDEVAEAAETPAPDNRRMTRQERRNAKKRKKQENSEVENYIMERENQWEDDGYLGEDG